MQAEIDSLNFWPARSGRILRLFGRDEASEFDDPRRTSDQALHGRSLTRPLLSAFRMKIERRVELLSVGDAPAGTQVPSPGGLDSEVSLSSGRANVSHSRNCSDASRDDPLLLGIVPNRANHAISQLTLSPRSHAPRGNAVPDAPRPRAGPKAATQSVEHGIPTRSMGTRGAPSSRGDDRQGLSLFLVVGAEISALGRVTCQVAPRRFGTIPVVEVVSKPKVTGGCGLAYFNGIGVKPCSLGVPGADAQRSTIYGVRPLVRA